MQKQLGVALPSGAGALPVLVELRVVARGHVTGAEALGVRLDHEDLHVVVVLGEGLRGGKGQAVEGVVAADNGVPLVQIGLHAGDVGEARRRAADLRLRSFDLAGEMRAAADIEAAAQQVAAAAAKRKELVGVTTTFSASVPQMRVDLNREQAKLLGVNVTEVFDALQSTFGALYVNDFNRDGRVFRVHLQSDAQFRSRPDDIRDVYVRGGSGELIPLTALVTLREVTGPEVIERFNVFPSAKVLGSAAPGFSSGEALAAMEQVADETLPEGYELAWTGTAYQESVTGGTSTTVFLVGVLMVFLVLAAQYERWTLPFAVILAVPLASILVTLIDIVVRDKDPAEEPVPSVLFPAKDLE